MNHLFRQFFLVTDDWAVQTDSLNIFFSLLNILHPLKQYYQLSSFRNMFVTFYAILNLCNTRTLIKFRHLNVKFLLTYFRNFKEYWCASGSEIFSLWITCLNLNISSNVISIFRLQYHHWIEYIAIDEGIYLKKPKQYKVIIKKTNINYSGIIDRSKTLCIVKIV